MTFEVLDLAIMAIMFATFVGMTLSAKRNSFIPLSCLVCLVFLAKRHSLLAAIAIMIGLLAVWGALFHVIRIKNLNKTRTHEEKTTGVSRRGEENEGR